MVKSVNLTEVEKSKIVIEEIEKFNKLIKDHKTILIAIGNL
jgi:hypothetical protein